MAKKQKEHYFTWRVLVSLKSKKPVTRREAMNKLINIEVKPTRPDVEVNADFEEEE